jgi:hypothetical protein
MSSLAAITFAVCIVYATIGNAAVLLILIRRRTTLRFMWAGAPFYLYRICNQASPPARVLTVFALSTNVALLLAIPALIWLEAISP